MSNTGKTSTYIRKTNVKESTVLNTGFKKTRFLHQAIVGDTLIQLTSLTTPTGAVNYSAPNVSELSQTNLMQWTQNFTLTSSVRGLLIQNISYIINGASTIKLLFSALDAEIFEGVIDHNARTGLTMLDAAPLVVSGTLLANTTDFNVGTPYKVNMFPSFKRGAVSVEIDGQPAYRTDGNAAFGPGITGDYQEISSGAGLGQILRFNSDLVNDRFIMVTSVGALVEKPNGSTMAALETVQGQIDALVPTVAELAGVPETNFQAAPNNTDLKSFGDRVLTLEINTAPVVAAVNNTISPNFNKLAYLSDQKASGTNGGSSSSGINTRVLNTISDPSSLISSFSANQFILPAGTYRMSAEAPASSSLQHRIRLRNISDSTTTLLGTSGYCPTAVSANTVSSIRGVFTITSSKTFELQHYFNTAQATNGLGIAATSGENEVYTMIEIQKVG